MGINATAAAEVAINRYIVNVKLEATFTTFNSILEYTSKDERFSDDGIVPAIDGAFQAALDLPGAISESKAKSRTTEVGGNDAINCYYSFNENDDIIHPAIQVGPDKGLGRVYNEIFDEQQHMLWMTFGIPKFANTLSFFKNSVDRELSILQNKGTYGMLRKAAGLAGTMAGVFAVLKFPPLALITLANIGLTVGSIPGRFYELRPMMPLYYKTVNATLVHLAINMGLIGVSKDKLETDGAGVDQLLRDSEIDILSILERKEVWDGVMEQPDKLDEQTEKLIDNQDSESMFSGFFSKAVDGVGDSLSMSKAFVGFRLEKSTDNSESASNATAEAAISSTLNGASETIKSARFNFGGIAGGDGAVSSAIGVATDMIGSFFSSAAGAVGLSGIAEFALGAGTFDIPERYTGSSFSKSYSFSFQLRAPLGDKLSIFHSIYVPLSMLIAAAFPRAIGRNTYTSPFLLTAYSKGRFAIPLGIIDSINIKRGDSEFGWNTEGLPTSVDVSISIKDLSAMMYTNISSGDAWKDIIGQNSSFQEYLLSLSGIGLAERLNLWKKLSRKKDALLKIGKLNVLNPRMIGLSIGNSRIGQTITAFKPTHRLPTN